jgi:glycosyltransferase involved in cell wall biosynthesis
LWSFEKNEENVVMISVAMCTYNGERFLPEQLDSIARQTLPVDELVVTDDGSTDCTRKILHEFAQKVPFKVSVYVNEQNLGSTKNFEKCLGLCSGDIIFLCDQDDVWYPNKVADQVAYFEANPYQDAVFSNATIINEQSQRVEGTIWDEVQFTDRLQRRWRNGHAHEILFGGYVVTGATLAIRREALDRLVPFPAEVPQLIHDAWIALVLSLEDKIGFTEEPLLSYRVHQTQQVGFGSKGEPVRLKDRMIRSREEKLAPLQAKAEDLQKLYLLLRDLTFIPREKLVKLYLRQRHFQRRATLPPNRLSRLKPIVKDVVSGRYLFSSKDWWLPAIGDLFE